MSTSYGLLWSMVDYLTLVWSEKAVQVGASGFVDLWTKRFVEKVIFEPGVKDG